MGVAVTAQQAYWFRNDDGSESGATFKGSQGSDQTIGTGQANRFRIRIIVEETNGGNANVPWPLYASYKGGAYFPVTPTSSYVQAITSLNDGWTITDEDLTTAQLTYSGTFAAGRYDDDGNAENNITLVSKYTEREFCLYIVDADVADADTITFRVYESSGVGCDAYNATPTLTVSKAVTDRNITGVSESITVTESKDASIGLEVSTSDSPSTEESVKLNEISFIAKSDGVGVAENADASILVAIDTSTGISIAESKEAIPTLDIDVSDGVGVVDTFIDLQFGEADVDIDGMSETVGVADSPALLVGISVDESQLVGIVDAPLTLTLIIPVGTADSINVTEGKILDLAILLTGISDAVNVAEWKSISGLGVEEPPAEIALTYDNPAMWRRGVKIVG